MKKVFFTIAFLSGLCVALSQTTGQIALNSSGAGPNSGASAQLSYLLGPVSEQGNKLVKGEYGIQGSAYTSEEFVAGKLYYNDDFEGNIFYRYNAYNEEIEIKNVNTNVAETAVRTLNRDKKISLLSPTGNSIEFKTYIDKKKRTQNGYLTKLRDGKYSFYKRIDVKYTQGQKAQNSFIPAIPARFTQFTEYYLEIEGINRIDELELSNRKLLKLIPAEQHEVLKQFMKKNKIKIKDQYDIYEVLDFLNKP